MSAKVQHPTPRANAMWTFLQHWQECAKCGSVKKFVLARFLCPTGRDLYNATHTKAKSDAQP